MLPSTTMTMMNTTRTNGCQGKGRIQQARCAFSLLWATFLLSSTATAAFQVGSHSPRTSSTTSLTSHLTSKTTTTTTSESDRRSFLSTITGCLGPALVVVGGGVLGSGDQAWAAGIDVSGLPREGGGNAALASQLRAYDGSGATRIKEVQQQQQQQQAAMPSSTSTKMAEPAIGSPIATWAYRANPGFNPRLTRTGPFGNLYQLNDMVEAPVGSKRRSIGIQFEFPNDWLQLDRNIGGIQYVDQRNGDKLYVFRASLPVDTRLEDLPKATLGDYLFDPQGSLAKSGQTIEDYKVSSAQLLSVCPNNMCATRRRFKIKYATVTGNGLRVERRALVDAYQIEQDMYMLMTSSNAVKFDQKDSLERETVENIVNSFQIDV